MKKYLLLLRIDHWIKQLFVLPGVVCALFFFKDGLDEPLRLVCATLAGLFFTSVIASANYVINEFLDARYDRFHPTKKTRSAVVSHVKGSVVWLMWLVLSLVGLTGGMFVNKPFALCLAVLWLMGLIYNVKPIRSKDITYVDVLSESLNNALRLLLGWFVVTDSALPPCSIVLGFWMSGAFLMATKRLAEYRMIGSHELAVKYRKSFSDYSETKLLCTIFFYGMTSMMLIGTFLVKYRIELLLFIPFLSALYCYYLYIAYKRDSCVQKPEKLYHERGLMLFCLLLTVLFCALLFINIPQLGVFTSNELIPL